MPVLQIMRPNSIGLTAFHENWAVGTNPVVTCSHGGLSTWGGDPWQEMGLSTSKNSRRLSTGTSPELWLPHEKPCL
eukprot:1160636-Pelagomonas_calceolata.AAC.10